MQPSSLLLIASMVASTLAKMHGNAICVDNAAGGLIYNDKATRAACDKYFKVHDGNEAWQSCPDCSMVEGPPPHCMSIARHMGGDQITQYCKDAGADNAKTS